MGYYERDYYRQSLPRGGFGHFVAWSVTTWLIVLNVVVFFADAALQRVQPAPAQFSYDESEDFLPSMPPAPKPLTLWGEFSRDKAVRHVQVWRFITYAFLHAGVWHLVGNMVGLYFFGPIVEAHLGSRRYLAFFLLCCLAGAVSFLLLELSHVLKLGPGSSLVGASAGIFGLLVAAAVIAPNETVFYYMFPITILMLAVGGMLLAMYTVVAAGGNSGGEAAHLGGGILGFLLMKNQHWLSVVSVPARRTQTVTRPGRRTRPAQKDWSKDFNR